MQRIARFAQSLSLALVAGLLLFSSGLAAAEPSPTPDPDAFVEADIELIPPPPGVTRAAQTAAPAPVTGVGGLVLPAELPKPAAVVGGLSAPGYLTAIAGNRSVLLSWYQSEGPRPVSGYLVYRGLSADAIPPRPINSATVTETNFSDSDVTSISGPKNRQAYFYKVRAFDVEGRLSPYSDVVSAMPSGPLLPPGKLSAAGYDSKVLLLWSAPVSTGDGELAGLRLLRGERSGELAPYKDLPPNALSYEDAGLSNGKALYYAVLSVDDKGNTSSPSPEARGLPYRALPAPQGLSALGVGDEAVRLKWAPPAAAGTFKVKGYNVYRSSGGPVDLASPPINKALIPGGRNRFEDSSDDSIEAPKKGVDYRYVVVAVDEEGNPSPASESSVAGPVASLTKLETGEIEVTKGNTLQISGRKTIDASYTWVSEDTSQNLASGALGGFQLDQQLQVRLTGKVGRKIKVDVDYDDKAVGNQQQKISVVYTGDQQEVFKEFAFGDILMDLSSNRTEFAGYNKSLFGAKLKLVSPDEKLRITAVGAQTKGITESKRIVGSFEQARTGNVLGEDKQDLYFQLYKYYYLSRDKGLVEGPDYIIPGSVEIYIDQPNFTIYQPNKTTVQDLQGREYNFQRLQPNVEFIVDNSTGLVTFTRNIGQMDNIAVAFRIRRANGSEESVGYNAQGAFDFSPASLDSDKDAGKTSDAKKLIQAGRRYGDQQYDSHMSMQFYKLGHTDILNPQLDPDFKLKIYQGQSVFYELDTRSNFSNVIEFDTRLGWMKFRVPFPFKAGNTQADLAMDANFDAVEKVFAPNQLDAYNFGTGRTNNFTIHIEYKHKVASYNLRFGIIRASEVILLDGRRLARDVDYYLDYDTGSLIFSNPDLVKETSVIDATYEYLPFGGQFTSTIWGTRGEYDITKDLSVGTTFLWNSADATAEVPDVRSSPYSLQILDGDIQARVPQNLVDGVTRRLPLLPEREDALVIRAKGEMARSWFRPNTYSRNNESGVAMIDSFESVDELTSASMDRTAWYPSSRPLRFTGDPGMAAADRRFSAFSTVQERAHDASTRAANNENPNRSMAQIRWAGFSGSNNWDSFVYSFGSSTPDAIKRASYLELWVKTDVPVTLNVDAGQINEDATNNGALDTESSTGILGSDQDVGFWTTNSAGSDAAGAYPNPDDAPGSYPDPAYWGRGNRVVDTEDVNGDGQLNRDNAYYRFTRTLSGSSNFQQVLIPLADAVMVGPELSVVPGDPKYYANVRQLRVWIQGAGAVNGQILIESIQFKGNKWQVRADPNIPSFSGLSVTADTDRFQVRAINRISDPFYSPNTNFFNKETNRSDDREQSLLIEYALTSLDQDAGRPYYQARKQLANGQDVDVGVYQKLRVDLYKPHDTLPGERFLVRLGIDDFNYFEYQIPLDGLGTGAWNSVTLALDGSDGRRTILGKPYLRQVRYVTLALHTLNNNLNTSQPDSKERIWVNNLRLTDAILREGGAQRLGFSYDLLGGALTVNHDLREVDSDFVKMDQEAIPPQRHERSQIVDARLNAVQGVPVSVRYEERERYTEPLRRQDPKYNRIFVDPDESSHKTTANLGFTKVPGLSLNSTASIEHTRQIFLQAYIDSQRELALPEDRVIVPNTNRDDLRLTQDATWRLPGWAYGFRGDELRLEGAFDENKVIFDRESVSLNNLSFKNVERRSRTMRGRYTGTFKAGEWLTLSPSYAYTLIESEGNIAIPTVQSGAAYYSLGDDRRSDGWIPQSRVINPSLQLQFKDLGAIKSPRIGYNVTQTRDYVRNELRSPGSLDISTSLNLASLGQGWEKMPSIDVTQGFAVDSVVNNDPRIRGNIRRQQLSTWLQENDDFGRRYQGVPDQNISSLALQEQQNFLQSAWWLRLEDLFLGENVLDPLHIENIAVTSSRRSNTGFGTRFDMPVMPNWTGTFSPRLTLRDERTMSAPEQVIRRAQYTVGSGVEFREPRIPWWRTLKPSALSLDYSFNNSDSFVVQLVDATRMDEALSANSISHTFNGTLPMRPTEAVAVTARMRWSASSEENYNGANKDFSTRRSSQQLDPDLTLTYFLKIDRPYKMPDMWPFHGRELRIRQNFRLDNTLAWAMRREQQKVALNALPESGSDTYSLLNTIGYDVLDNVKMKISFEQKYFTSLFADKTINQRGNYYSLTFKLGLEAIF